MNLKNNETSKVQQEILNRINRICQKSTCRYLREGHFISAFPEKPLDLIIYYECRCL